METRKTENGIWGSATHSNRAPTSFASILKEEESKRVETKSLEMDQEEQLLLLAIERSKADAQYSDGTTNTFEHSEEEEDEDFKLALQMSLMETTASTSLLHRSSSHTSADIPVSIQGNSNLKLLNNEVLLRSSEQYYQSENDIKDDQKPCSKPVETSTLLSPVTSTLEILDQPVEISLEDQKAIQKALLEADEEEQRRSMELALLLAQEEQETETIAARQRRGASMGNVRIKTRAEVESEMISWNSRRISPPRMHSRDMDEAQNEAPGFRMNTADAHEWTRRNQSSVIGPGNEIRTKHDSELNGLSNAHRLGLDREYDDDVIVSNRAYNSFMSSLKRSSTNKGVAAHGTGRANSDADNTKRGMDPSVRLCITHAINNGVIEHLNGIVKEGKEAVIHHADGVETSSFDVAVKVFKKIQEFRARGDYVDGDPRYRRESFRKASPHEQLALWAEKEYRNIVRAERAGVPVPSPIMVKENILFMQFVGEDGWPAPQLRELDLRRGSTRWSTLYAQVVMALKR